jgi:hypothetical protein
MVAMNTLSPHVKEGTNLTLDQFLIKYGGQSEEEPQDGEFGEPEVWFDQSFLQYSPDQMSTTQ